MGLLHSSSPYADSSVGLAGLVALRRLKAGSTKLPYTRYAGLTALIRTLRGLPCPHLRSGLAVPAVAVLRAARAASDLLFPADMHPVGSARAKDSY